MASVTKADLVSVIATQAGLNRATAETTLVAALDRIRNALTDGNKVTLVGFGTFAVASRAERTGRNPQTKAPMVIPAHNTVTFKAGSALKQALN